MLVEHGIVYIVSGFTFTRMALRSILSLKHFGGECAKLPIRVYSIGDCFLQTQLTELGCECCLLETWKDYSDTQNHRRNKARVMRDIDFDKYIMIDADTFVQNDFTSMFDAIPENGVAGIQDGNFDSHIQMSKFLFLRGKFSDQEAGKITEQLLGVDYSLSNHFPFYYNVGVFGLSKLASHIIGTELYDLLPKLYESEYYNHHDEQLPINSIIYKNKITANLVDSIFNYTKSRTKKNKKLNIHDDIKHNVVIIHNRTAQDSEWIQDKSKVVQEKLDILVTKTKPFEISQRLYEKYIKPRRKNRTIITLPDLASSVGNPLELLMLKIISGNKDFDILTHNDLGFDLCSIYGEHIGYKRDRGKISYIFIDEHPVLIDNFDQSHWTHSSPGRLGKVTEEMAVKAIIKLQYATNNYNGCSYKVYPFLYPAGNDFVPLEKYPVYLHLKYREEFATCADKNKFDSKIFARWKSFSSRPKFEELCKEIDGTDVSGEVIDIDDYMVRMSRSKFALSARGGGKLCHRDMEACFIGVPLLRQNTGGQMWRPFVGNKHYIEVSIENFREVFEYYNNHYDEALQIGENGRNYYDECYSQKGCQLIFKQVVEQILFDIHHG